MQLTSLLEKTKKKKETCVLCGTQAPTKDGLFIYGKFVCNECAERIAKTLLLKNP